MNLLTLYQRETEKSGLPVLLIGSISGLAQTALLGIITLAADTAANKVLRGGLLLLFLVMFAIMIFGKRYAMKQAVIIGEGIIKNVRVRLADKIRNSELLFLERLGKGDLYTRLAHDADFISQSVVMIINAAHSVLVVIFCLIYIAILSRFTSVITLLTISLGISNYISQQHIILEELEQTRRKEGKFFDMINQILDGFKELKVNRKKSQAYFKAFTRVADENETLKVDVNRRFIIRSIYAQFLFFILLAVVVFLMPRFEAVNSELIIRITAAILFIIGPADIAAGAIPLFTRGNMAVKHLYELESQLDAVSKLQRMKQPERPHPIPAFESITFEGVMFSYEDQEGQPLFTVGPADLKVRQGEILFLIGGNGSGKTTLLKLLTGLYYPDAGKIKVDNLTITPLRYQAYRELFVTIFSDFHLFDRLYGIDTIDYSKILELLQTMELEEKTDVVEGAFTNLDLSNGQRKRLAMIAAMLEDRPIYVLDEWAADQDPIFRKYFYESLLSELKARGKTIIAVSHDDRYFHVADRVLKMDYGQFVDPGFKQPSSTTEKKI